MVSNLEQRRLSSLGLRRGFLFRGSEWDSWTEPIQVEVEEKALWKLDEVSLSLKRLRGGGLGGGDPSLGTLEDMLRKSPDTGIFVEAHFQSSGTW